MSQNKPPVEGDTQNPEDITSGNDQMPYSRIAPTLHIPPQDQHDPKAFTKYILANVLYECIGCPFVTEPFKAIRSNIKLDRVVLDTDARNYIIERVSMCAISHTCFCREYEDKRDIAYALDSALYRLRLSNEQEQKDALLRTWKILEEAQGIVQRAQHVMGDIGRVDFSYDCESISCDIAELLGCIANEREKVRGE